MISIIGIKTRNGNILQLVASRDIAVECIRISYSAFHGTRIIATGDTITVEVPGLAPQDFFLEEISVWMKPDHL